MSFDRAKAMHLQKRNEKRPDTVERSEFGRFPGGTPVHRFTLGDPGGGSVAVSEYGCALTSVIMPDRTGNLSGIILSYPSLVDYIADTDYVGVTVGRYANRVTGAQFTIDRTRYQLSANEGNNHLHGGFRGFGKRLWKGSVVSQSEIPAVQMELLSSDGEEGYPGNLRCRATLTLRDRRALDVVYEAETDRPTIVNLTLHPYFNLAGAAENLSEHLLFLDADRFLPIRSDGMPTGEIRPVDGTPFDFREPAVFATRLSREDEQLRLGNGYDHCWALREREERMKLAARVVEPTSGRTLELHTTAPGVQFYSGNFLGTNSHANGHPGFQARSGFCLEPEAWPDSPNHDAFPKVILHPGELYTHRITYIFGTE
ncbi:MAG: aldose epimerase family protein [bacterium]